MRNIQIQMLFSSFDETLFIDLINFGRFILCDSMVKVTVLAVKTLKDAIMERKPPSFYFLLRIASSLKGRHLLTRRR